MNVEISSVVASCISSPHLRPVIAASSNGVVFFNVAPDEHAVPEIVVKTIEIGVPIGEVLPDALFVKHSLAKPCIVEMSVIAADRSLRREYVGNAIPARMLRVDAVIKSSVSVKPFLFFGAATFSANRKILQKKTRFV